MHMLHTQSHLHHSGIDVVLEGNETLNSKYIQIWLKTPGKSDWKENGIPISPSNCQTDMNNFFSLQCPVSKGFISPCPPR